MACGVALVGWHAQTAPDPLEPVMVVELAADMAAPAAQPSIQPSAAITPVDPMVTPMPPRIVVPPAPAVASSDPVALPQPPVQPVTRVEAAAPGPIAAAAVPARTEAAVARTGTADTPGTDEKARKQEADYYAQLAAYLNRKKSYPAEAKKARQQGVVAVRFTVGRTGEVSGIAVKRSSGHDLLDAATLELVRRVAPLPAFPASMKQATATITVPIEYSLRTS